MYFDDWRKYLQVTSQQQPFEELQDGRPLASDPQCGPFGKNNQTTFGKNNQTTFGENNQTTVGKNNQTTFDENNQTTFGKENQTTFRENNRTVLLNHLYIEPTKGRHTHLFGGG